MVKDKELGTGELFRRTEPKKDLPAWPDDNSDLDEGRIMANGVGLRLGEIRALDAIADRFELARNALIRLAVRRMILEYRAGNLDLMKLAEDRPPVRQPKRRLRMPKK